VKLLIYTFNCSKTDCTSRGGELRVSNWFSQFVFGLLRQHRASVGLENNGVHSSAQGNQTNMRRRDANEGRDGKEI
jgi:hypothetical protein